MTRGIDTSELATSSAVQVWTKAGRYRGSGFFVRPRLVATCAHVVKDLPDDVVVRWQERTFAAKVLVRDPPRQGATIAYEYPDVAFLGLEEFDNPVPILDTQPVEPGTEVLVVGFSQVNPAERVGDEIRAINATGESGGYLTLDGAQIVSGLSGAPVIRDGRVRAMLKSGPVSEGSAGYAVPAAEINQSLRRHRARLGAYRGVRPPLRRPRPGEVLHQLLTAQVQAARRFPYQVAELTKRRPPELSDVYVEQRAEARGPGAARVRTDGVYRPTGLTPAQMLRRHRNALVIGDAGGGKSTLLYSLVGESAAWWLGNGSPDGGDRAEPPAGRVVPVLVAAVDLIGDRSWSMTLARGVERNLGGLLDVELTAEVMRRPPAYGADWLVLIDGFDEIPKRGQRADLVDTLAHRIAEYGTSSRFVIASRELYAGELGRLRTSLGRGERQRLGEYTLRPFGRDAIRTFAVRWFAPTDDEPQRPPPDDFIKAVEVGGLAQLVEVPLLATISAIVYEEAVGQSLPIDRAGLYEKFVSVLLTLRRSQPGAVDVVRQQLRGSSPAAEEYGRFVYERRRQCLSFLAARLLVDKVGPADALTEWVRNQAEPMPADVTVDQVREILVGTGLVVPRGEDIVFLHQSFAEYLASLALVPAFRPRTWLKGVRDHGADSLGLFRFAAWVRAGNDPMPIVTDLLREHRQRRYPHLRDVAAMIEDGGILVGSGEAAVDAVWHAVRRGSSLTPAATGRRQRSPDEPDPVVGDMLRAVYQRSRGSNRLADMVTDRTVRVVKRVQAAEILIKDGSPDERDRTVDDLVDLAYRARLSDYDRLWALYYLAKYGGDRERPHALQRMTAMVETSQWLPVRSRALALLAETGEVIAGAAALARRAMDSRYSVAERLSTLELLTTFLVLEARPDTPPDPYAAGLELDEGVWRQPPRLRSAGFGNDRRVETYIAQLRTVIVRIARQDPVTADHLAQRFVRDRGITWIRRAHLIRGLRAAGFADIADAALLAVAYDSGEPAYNRVAMLELKRFDNHFRRDDESFAILTAWIYDEDQPPVLRSAALGSMLRDSPAEDIRRVAGDRRLPVRMRTSAAFQLTGTRPGIAEAQVALRAMATEEALSLPDRVTVDFGRALLAVTGRTVDLVRLLGTAFATAFRRVPVPRRRRAVPAEQGQPPA